MAKKVLIIDDEPDVVDFLKDVFDDEGFETEVAYNGNEGLAKLEAFKPDIITLDMDMPEKGGTMFYAGLRKNESLKDTPVVVISGVGPRPPALKKGVPVITKPVSAEVVMQHVNEMLG